MSLPRFVAAPAARLRHLLCRTTRHPLIPAQAAPTTMPRAAISSSA